MAAGDWENSSFLQNRKQKQYVRVECIEREMCKLIERVSLPSHCDDLPHLWL